MSAEAKDFITRLMTVDPKRRMTARGGHALAVERKWLRWRGESVSVNKRSISGPLGTLRRPWAQRGMPSVL